MTRLRDAANKSQDRGGAEAAEKGRWATAAAAGAGGRGAKPMIRGAR